MELNLILELPIDNLIKVQSPNPRWASWVGDKLFVISYNGTPVSVNGRLIKFNQPKTDLSKFDITPLPSLLRACSDIVTGNNGMLYLAFQPARTKSSTLIIEMNPDTLEFKTI